MGLELCREKTLEMAKVNVSKKTMHPPKNVEIFCQIFDQFVERGLPGRFVLQNTWPIPPPVFSRGITIVYLELEEFFWNGCLVLSFVILEKLWEPR